MDDELRRSIEADCIRAIYRFAMFNDAHDHNGLANMFTEDGSFARPSAPAQPITGREMLRAFFRDRPKQRTRHFMCNPLIEILSKEVVDARSYVLLVTGEQGDKILAGNFDDRLHRTADGAWLFHRRRGSLAFAQP